MSHAQRTKKGTILTYELNTSRIEAALGSCSSCIDDSYLLYTTYTFLVVPA